MPYYTIANPIAREDEQQIPMLFANFPKIAGYCADGNRLPITIVLGGDEYKRASLADSLHLPDVTKYLQKVADSLGLELDLKSRISWECDPNFKLRSDPVVRPFHEADFAKFFPDIPQPLLDESFIRLRALEERLEGQSDTSLRDLLQECRNELQTMNRMYETHQLQVREWHNRCLDRMKASQTNLDNQRDNLLTTTNLIVLGAPKVNRVMSNICEYFFQNFSQLGELRMFLRATAGDSAFKLRRENANGGWVDWHGMEWNHRNIGWLHMIKNPWATEYTRFLIYLGGFFSQGTQAATLKLRDILRDIANGGIAEGVIPNGLQGQLLTARSDYPYDENVQPENRIPGHVVQARVPIPTDWFFKTKRLLDQIPPPWTLTPPAFDGTITEFWEVV